MTAQIIHSYEEDLSIISDSISDDVHRMYE